MLSSSRFFLLGEALIDLIQEKDGRYSACLGGAAFNVGLALARLGLAPTYLNRLAADAWGQSLTRCAEQEGLRRSALSASRHPTSLAVVSLSACGQPIYTFYRAAIADRDWTPDEVLAAADPRPGDLLHTGGLALLEEDWPRLREVLEAWRTAGGRLSIDLNVRLAATGAAEAYRAAVAEAAQQADLLKLSDEDLVSLGLLAPDSSSESACAALTGWLARLGAAPSLAVLTRGAQPGWWITASDQPLQFAPEAVSNPVDTVGAGDCFWAAVLAGLHRQGLLAQGVPSLSQSQSILSLACRAAGHTIARRGCDPIRAAELFQESP